MDGGTFSSLIEVTQDVFAGSLALPIFNGPQSGDPYDAPERGGLPAGRRIEWRHPGEMFGPPCAVRLTTAAGTSYWLSRDMPMRTYDEAMDIIAGNLAGDVGAILAEDRERDEREAAKYGLTAEQLRIKRKDDETRWRRRNAARKYQERTEDYLRTMAATGKLKD